MAANAPAQTSLPLPLESITIDQGLSQGFVTGIIQDKKGFMWFTTGDGLNKYDGYTFTVYHHDPGDTTSISSDDLVCIVEDSHERLWIGTRHNGIDLFDREKGLFTHFHHAAGNSLRSDEIMGITEDKGGAVWIRTDQGIDRLEIAAGKSGTENAHFTHILLDSAFEATKNKYGPPGVFVDSRNRVLVTASNKVWEVKFSGKLRSYSLLKLYQYPTKYPLFIATMAEDTVNHFLFLKSEEVIRFLHGDFNAAERIYSGANMQSPWTIDKNHRIWIPGPFNVVRIGITSGRIENTALEGPDKIKALSYSTVFYTDRAGVVWIGTGGYGILKYASQKEYFHHILPGNYFYQLLKSNEGSILTSTFQDLTIKKNQPVAINPLMSRDLKKK